MNRIRRPSRCRVDRWRANVISGRSLSNGGRRGSAAGTLSARTTRRRATSAETSARPDGSTGSPDIAESLPKGSRRADFGLGVSDALAQVRKQLFLARPGGHQVKRMDRTPLADSIDAPDPLLEPHWVPRQFQVDDDAASPMKVESLAGRIRREKNPAPALRERSKHSIGSLRHAAAASTWNCRGTPTRLEQRIGRVDRIGQRRTVHAFHLVAAGTGEEQLLADLRKRIAHAQTEIGAPDPFGNDSAMPTRAGASVRPGGRLRRGRALACPARVGTTGGAAPPADVRRRSPADHVSRAIDRRDSGSAGEFCSSGK